MSPGSTARTSPEDAITVSVRTEKDGTWSSLADDAVPRRARPRRRQRREPPHPAGHRPGVRRPRRRRADQGRHRVRRGPRRHAARAGGPGRPDRAEGREARHRHRHPGPVGRRHLHDHHCDHHRGDGRRRRDRDRPRRHRPGGDRQRRRHRDHGPHDRRDHRPGHRRRRLAGGRRGHRQADDLLARPVGRRRADARQVLAALRRGARGLRAPHGQREQLHGRPGARDHPRHLRVPHPVPGLVRRRLQLPRRPLRPDLGGPLRRSGPARRRCAHARLQRRRVRDVGDRQLRDRAAVGRDGRRLRPAVRLEAQPARRERRVDEAVGDQEVPPGDQRAPRRRPDGLSRQVPLRADPQDPLAGGGLPEVVRQPEPLAEPRRYGAPGRRPARQVDEAGLRAAHRRHVRLRRRHRRRLGTLRRRHRDRRRRCHR